MFPDIIKNLLFIALGIIGIGVLIGFHELGHFIFAKIFKVSTPSFSIGMGPKIFKKKIGETVFSLSAIPLGGYVEIAGMSEVGQGEQKEAKRTDEYAFSSKPYWQKLLILCGGILFNMIFAYFVFFILFMTGIPKNPMLFPESVLPIVEVISSGSPAEKYHLQVDDKIVSIDGRVISNALQFNQELHPEANKEVKLVVERNGQIIDVPVVLDAAGKVGIGFKTPTSMVEFAPEPFVTSAKKAFKATNSVFMQTVSAFSSIFTKKSVSGLGGPIAVISQTIKGAKQGFKIFLLLLAFISINLAVLNLIPLPILDGGQIAFTTIEAILRRPVSDQIKIVIHYICWVGILILALYLTFEDLKKIIRG
ncbi:MAG: site-2 protease family protein [Candidatus Babeliales bacterium]|nr:site-2 protease family protein [Candidatus Babeliales bacterium]